MSITLRQGGSLTQVAQQGQQVFGVAELEDGQSEGHLGWKESHGQVLDKLSRQAVLQLSHVGRHVVGEENKHADVVLHLQLSDLEEGEAAVTFCFSERCVCV